MRSKLLRPMHPSEFRKTTRRAVHKLLLELKIQGNRCRRQFLRVSKGLHLLNHPTPYDNHIFEHKRPE
uniref:Putative ovule protein n=1 Tax=Solanum chacoense TaxID=4108 RepID=A0A0V0HH61_SOLCH